ncbi:MAG: heme-copper oxidase subunit III [Nibricoccus sp.]
MSSHAATIDHHHDATTSTGIPNKKLFMWAFLASDCMFFGALISTHLIYRLHPPPGSPNVAKVFSIELTSFSTFILLMSSLLMALAVNSIQKGLLKSTRHNLLGTIFFGLIFLGCQVYEFTHFAHEKDLKIGHGQIFADTFYTLTGTHGCHVAIGVLWLILMYIRSFKPADGSAWIARAGLHLAVFGVTIVAGMASILGFIHALQTHENLDVFAQHHVVSLIVMVAGLLGLYALSRKKSAVEFGEANAIDVESMGLYWHFVDIVWIVIFTAVYLLEYL